MASCVRVRILEAFNSWAMSSSPFDGGSFGCDEDIGGKGSNSEGFMLAGSEVRRGK